MIDLEAVAKKYHAAFLEDVKIKLETVDAPLVMEILAYYSKHYGNDLVLYGGQTATPIIWGFKQMRKMTTDFDFVISEKKLPFIIQKEELKYNHNYNIFFGYYKKVVCCFNCQKIHDWIVPFEFFSSAAKFVVGGNTILICSREYTVALKLRRAVKAARLFGKDAIDIINLIAAPNFRKELPPFNFEKAVMLIRDIAEGDVLDFVSEIYTHLNHIPAVMKDAVEKEIRILDTLIREALQ